MTRISFLQSLMEFNKRVLYNGQIKRFKYTNEDLKNTLFFNQVFISNTNEIFEKYNYSEIISDYSNCIKRYNRNIKNIIDQFCMINKAKLVTEDSFEKRYIIESQIKDLITTLHFKDINNVKYKFKEDQLHYISIFNDNHVSISYIDSRSEIYKTVFKMICVNGIRYFKTDECILEYINNKLKAKDTIVCKLMYTSGSKNKVKIDVNGNKQIIHKICGLFDNIYDDGYIIYNPYLYTKDIELMIKDNIGENKKQKQKKVAPDLRKLFKIDSITEYPVNSFDDYLKFISCASQSNMVEAIYVTLYRIGNDPTIFYILKHAHDKGIKVHANIELCAYNESINKMWYNEFKQAGIHVTTFKRGEWKVHSKITLIRFINGTYACQIGTGNYHTKTTTQYTDLSYITTDENICNQAKKLFELFDGKKLKNEFNDDLLVTQYNMRSILYKYIDKEGRKGRDGFIFIKCNSLHDDEMIKHLDTAANKGCIIHLVVRGVCTWIPDRLNDNVHIKSIIWEKLEHSRVYCFGKKHDKIYLGSLDLVTNKLDKRIETLVKIKKPYLKLWMINYINRYITTRTGSWTMQNDGSYRKD